MKKLLILTLIGAASSCALTPIDVPTVGPASHCEMVEPEMSFDRANPTDEYGVVTMDDDPTFVVGYALTEDSCIVEVLP